LKNKQDQGIDQISNSIVFDRSLDLQEKQVLKDYLNFEKSYNEENRFSYNKYISTSSDFKNEIKDKKIIK
jgi:hypothetical protein